jgi:hypothetical protein
MTLREDIITEQQRRKQIIADKQTVQEVLDRMTGKYDDVWCYYWSQYFFQ